MGCRGVAVQPQQAISRYRYSAVDSGSSGNVWMVDIEKLMKELARDRSVFHSEADFQHALGWQIHARRTQGMPFVLSINPERSWRCMSISGWPRLELS